MLAFLLCLTLPAAPEAATFDPLSTRAAGRPIELVVIDDARDREIPLRVHVPADTAAAPVVMLSHGLGGSRTGLSSIADHLAGRGYVVVALQHPGSDEDVWRSAGLLGRLSALKSAASATQLIARCDDVTATIDALEEWHAAPDHPLAGRLDLTRLGMSGHSFGAMTTQYIAGQSGRGGHSRSDDRVKAAVAYSPSLPPGRDPARSLAAIDIPMLLLTGTKDETVVGDRATNRARVFDALPDSIARYELILDGGDHAVFTTPGGRRSETTRRQHQSILALTAAFWDAHLRDDAAARSWLTSASVRDVLTESDTWRHAGATSSRR